MTDYVTPYLQKLGLPVTRENWIAFNWPEVPDPWTPEDEAQLPPELQEERESEPTRDDATVWIESKHPRRGKGPGGGEFTSKGQGGAGGGGEIGPGPTVHVHVHRPGQQNLAQQPQRKFLPEGEVISRPTGWNDPRPDIGIDEPWEQETEAAEHGRLDPEDLDNEYAVRNAKNAQKTAAAIKAYRTALKPALKAVKDAGLRFSDVPSYFYQNYESDIGHDHTPPRDPQRTVATAPAAKEAISALAGRGMDALAEHLTKDVPIVFSSLVDTSGSPFAKQQGDGLAHSVSAEVVHEASRQYVVINTNSYPESHFDVFENSPLSQITTDKMKKAGASWKELQAFELRSTLIHEYGHILDNWFGNEMSDDLVKISATHGGADGKGVDDWLRKSISGYASASPYEAAAEAFYRLVTEGTDWLPDDMKDWGAKWLKKAKDGPGPEQDRYVEDKFGDDPDWDD